MARTAAAASGAKTARGEKRRTVAGAGAVARAAPASAAAPTTSPIRTDSAQAGQSKKCASKASRSSSAIARRRYRSAARVRTASWCSIRFALYSWCTGASGRYRSGRGAARARCRARERLADPPLGPVEQYPKVLPVHAHGAADVVLVAFLEKQCVQKLAILGWQPGNGVPDPFVLVGVEQGRLDTRAGRLEGGVVFRDVLAPFRFGAIGLEQHVVARGVHERAEAAGRLQAALPAQRGQHAQEGFLLGVFHERR